VETGTCQYCQERIRWSAVLRQWRATGYADINGYCFASPELEHTPRQEAAPCDPATKTASPTA